MTIQDKQVKVNFNEKEYISKLRESIENNIFKITSSSLKAKELMEVKIPILNKTSQKKHLIEVLLNHYQILKNDNFYK